MMGQRSGASGTAAASDSGRWRWRGRWRPRPWAAAWVLLIWRRRRGEAAAGEGRGEREGREIAESPPVLVFGTGTELQLELELADSHQPNRSDRPSLTALCCHPDCTPTALAHSHAAGLERFAAAAPLPSTPRPLDPRPAESVCGCRRGRRRGLLDSPPITADARLRSLR
jgi:hypothetical protein